MCSPKCAWWDTYMSILLAYVTEQAWILSWFYYNELYPR